MLVLSPFTLLVSQARISNISCLLIRPHLLVSHVSFNIESISVGSIKSCDTRRALFVFHLFTFVFISFLSLLAIVDDDLPYFYLFLVSDGTF